MDFSHSRLVPGRRSSDVWTRAWRVFPRIGFVREESDSNDEREAQDGDEDGNGSGGVHLGV